MANKVIYWRRELPPLSEEIEATHEVEAESPRVHYDHGDRTTQWGTCYPLLLVEAERRIEQEVSRLGGTCAHVLDEQITAKVDDANAEFALRGRFRYVMYVHPKQ